MKILVLNAGSSSQKCSLYEVSRGSSAAPPMPLWERKADWSEKRGGGNSHREAVESLLEELRSGPRRAIEGRDEIAVVGHRVVHGGSEFHKPTRITPGVIRKLLKLAELAPLHNKAAVEGIRAVEGLLGRVPQVAVFDTAFHHTLPLEAAVYPGPYKWFENGIRRYGFHGINHEYCAERAAQLLRRKASKVRLITCHLGNGCSLAAIRGGRSVDTTMGFTPLDGLMMGTRPGSLDPGILTYLIRTRGYAADELDEILNHESGLLGISGLSNDMRALLTAKRRGNKRAKLAFDIFVHRLRAGIGSMLAALRDMDALIFTAGIGENSVEVRAAACEAFGYLGLKLDERKNRRARPDQNIAGASSKVPVLVIRAQEDWAIARACWRFGKGGSR